MQKLSLIFLMLFSSLSYGQDQNFGQINIESFVGQLSLPARMNGEKIRAVLIWDCQKSASISRHTKSCGEKHKGQYQLPLSSTGQFSVPSVRDEYSSLFSRFVRFTATISFEIQKQGRWTKIPHADFTYYFDDADAFAKLKDDTQNLALFSLQATEFKIHPKVNTSAGVRPLYDLRQDGLASYQWKSYFQIYFQGLSSYNTALKIDQRMDGDYVMLPAVMHIDRYDLTSSGYKIHFVPNLTLMYNDLISGSRPHLSVPVIHHVDSIPSLESPYPAIWENIFNVTL